MAAKSSMITFTAMITIRLLVCTTFILYVASSSVGLVLPRVNANAAGFSGEY